VNHTDGTVMSVARQGGQPNVLATGQDKPWRVSVDDLYVYWVGESMKGSVMRVPKHGGEPAVVASASAPATVEARGGDVYWLTGDGSLFRCAARGGSIATLAQTQTNPSRMALDRDAVYWTNGNGTVMKIAQAGGPTVVLASGQGDPRDIAVDDRNVYWSTRGGVIRSVSKAGGTPCTVAESPGDARGICVNDRWLYFTVTGSGLVMRALKHGGAAEEMGSGFKYPLNMATSAKSIFFTCYTGGTIVRMDV